MTVMRLIAALALLALAACGADGAPNPPGTAISIGGTAEMGMARDGG
jgi:hypothetical protein